jgi:flagellar L-ring protein precursor FlgH
MIRRSADFGRGWPWRAWRPGLMAGAVLALAACVSQPEYEETPFVADPFEGMPAVEHTSGSIYSPVTWRAYITDPKASRVGDILTVVLRERTAAEKQASTSTSKDGQIGYPAPTVFDDAQGWLETDIEGGNQFDGEGESSQSNSLSGSITVVVSRVLPNGNLVVTGEKWLTLNQGKEFVRLHGVVRPLDVTSDNTVLSSQIANARIAYSGKGPLADSNRMGWLQRFFNSGWAPY